MPLRSIKKHKKQKQKKYYYDDLKNNNTEALAASPSECLKLSPGVEIKLVGVALGSMKEQGTKHLWVNYHIWYSLHLQNVELLLDLIVSWQQLRREKF